MMRWAMVLQSGFLFLLLLFVERNPAAAASPDSGTEKKPQQMIPVWDTARPSAGPLTTATLAAAHDFDWLRVSPDTTAAAFQGDAVVSNGRITMVVRKQAHAAEVYALGRDGMIPRLQLQLLAPGGEPAAHLEGISLIENTKAAACLEVLYKTSQGTELAAKLRIKKGEVSVQAEPGRGAARLRVDCPGRFVVLPDFFADDILIDARSIPLGKIELPSENFLLHLAADGAAVATCVFESRKQDVAVALSGTPEQRMFTASEIPFEGKRVWVALLEGPGMWHARDVKTEDAGKVLPLDWKMPYPAHWRVDFTRNNDLTDSWDMLLQQKDGSYSKPSLLGGGADRLNAARRRWNTVLGNYPYPCWSEQNGRGYLQPLHNKTALKFRGPVVVYPMNRVQQTPLDAYTVVDIMRNTLGVGPCEHILDLEGQKAEYKGRATCSCRDELAKIYSKGQQKQKHAEIEKILSDGLIFVTHIRGRISRYVEFGHGTRQYLAEQKKAHPELGDFLDEMDKITQEIDERVARRADKIQTPAHVANMNEEFRKNVLDYEGPDALTKCREYSTALVVIGDNQDELSGECRWVVKSLRQRAGIRLALDPRVATVATEIRARTQEALRNPASHEGARH